MNIKDVDLKEFKKYFSELKLKEDISDEELWRLISNKFKISPNAAYKLFNETNWDSLEDEAQLKKETEFSQDTMSKKVEDLLDKKKEKTIISHQLKKQNEFLSKLARQEIIIEKIVSSVIATPEIKVEEIKYPSPNNFLTRPQEAVLCFGDVHIGLAVKEDEVGNLGRYNTEIFKKRLSNLEKKVTAITEHHRKISQLDTLNIFMLGDIVHGSNDAGEWGFLHTEINIIEQMFMGIREIQKFILNLNRVYKNIKVSCVFGNHGRCERREKEKRYVNWDYIIYNILKTGLSNQKNIEFEIPKSPFLVSEILGNKFLITHGDQVKSWGGLPFYGMVRSETRFRTLLERTKDPKEVIKLIEEENIEEKEELIKFVLNYSKTFQYLILGHYHSMAELETNSGGKIILNSSFAGGDDYSINTLMTANSAAQKFFGVHNEGKSWTYDIMLDRE